MLKSILILTNVLLIICTGIGLAEENPAPTVMNVRAAQQGDCSNAVDIYYDLFDAEGNECYIYVKASIDEGKTWDLPVAHISGDVTVVDHETRLATTVSPGVGKHIVWELGKDSDKLVDDVQLKVTAERCTGTGVAEMCFVPAGTFQTSTNAQVYLDSYWIDKYEVTNALYCEFLNAGGNEQHYRPQMEITATGTEQHYAPLPGRAQYPLRYVTWDDAVAYCDWRSEKEGLPAGSYYLPTEAQWEKAAGWDPVLNKLWTYAIQSDSISCDKANYHWCVGAPTEVGHYTDWCSYYGCYDMSGNVFEWCFDWYLSEAYPTNASNPIGPDSGTRCVLRGGDWINAAKYSETGSRHAFSPTSVYSNFGFRCARTIK